MDKWLKKMCFIYTTDYYLAIRNFLPLTAMWMDLQGILLREISQRKTNTLCYPLCDQSFSHVWLFLTPWTIPSQAPLSMGILQVILLEWVAMPSSRGLSQPRDWTQVSWIAGRFFTVWATGEAHIITYMYSLKNKTGECT